MVGGPRDFWGSEILAKRDFLGSMKDGGIFWGREFLWVLYFSSAQINNNISAIYCLCGLFVIKFADTETLRVSFFLGGGVCYKSRHFSGIKYEPLLDPLVIKICEWNPWG